MSNSSVPLLSAHSITKSFGPRTARHQVLFDVSADVHAGECLAVIGGSGSGKSLVFLTEKAPAIRGIGIVCSGGGDPGVRREITSLLSSVFGIGSNCIFVTARG